MSGFLSDGIRDLLAVAGFALAILQTWLAIKSLRTSSGQQKARGTKAVYPIKLKVAAFALSAALVVILADATLVFHEIGNPARTAVTKLRQTKIVEVENFTSVSLWALAYIVGGAALAREWGTNWSKASARSRALVLLTHGMGIMVTLSAAVALWWGRGKSFDEPSVVAATTFGFWTLLWVYPSFIFSMAE